MPKQTSKQSNEPFNAYINQYGAEDRQKKTFLIIIAIVISLGVGYAFLRKMQILGDLNAYVPGIVSEVPDNSGKGRGQEYPNLNR